MNIVQELREKRAKIWDNAKDFLDSKRTADGLVSEEDSKTYEKMESEVVNFGKEIERLERQAVIDLELSKAVNKPIRESIQTHEKAKKGIASDEYKDAFWKAMRNRNGYEIRDILQIGQDVNGGYLVPDEFERQLVESLEEENIFRKLATIITTSSGDRKIPVVATKGTASWIDEGQEIPESDNTFGQVSIGAFKLATLVKISEEQLSSYEAQVDYYTRYIQSKNGWEFVEVYTDEGISATNTKKRDGFKRMIKDALDKKIDLIITKSVSRFARNTVDTLTTVRKLKEKGVEVYFEKENIYTLDSKGELLITIMSSLAQEESRSISENVTWGQRKRFADGKVSLPYKSFLGYEKGEDGVPKVVEQEAKIVRLIYRLFLEGKTASAIAQYLTNKDIPTPTGRKKWYSTTIQSILTNEKYKGDALLQKGYTVDFLTKKKKKNEGEVPQYYVKNSHQAIISAEIYDMVQEELRRRSSSGTNHSCANPFSGKIMCGECGNCFVSKVWHSNDKYRRVIWQCNKKFKNKEKFRTPHLTEKQIKQAFIKEFNKLIDNKDEVIRDCENTVLSLANTEKLDGKISKLQEEIDVVIGLMRRLIYENSRKAINQDEYNKKYTSYTEKYEKLRDELSNYEEKKQELIARRDKIKVFIHNLGNLNELISEFDEKLWYVVVDNAIVHANGKIEFKFKN